MKKNIPDLLNVLTKMDPKQQYAVLGAVLIGIFLIDYCLLTSPQLSRLQKLSPKLGILIKDYTQAQENIQKSPSYTNEVNRLKKQADKISQVMKSLKEVDQVLERISRIAKENGLTINQIVKNFDAQKKLMSNKEVVYYSLPIFVEASSGYHDFGRFLSQIEQDPVLNITGFSIKANPQDAKKHSIELTINVLVYEESKEAKNEK